MNFVVVVLCCTKEDKNGKEIYEQMYENLVNHNNMTWLASRLFVVVVAAVFYIEQCRRKEGTKISLLFMQNEKTKRGTSCDRS